MKTDLLRDCAGALLILMAAAQVAKAETLIATRPGLMCTSAEALAKLTLPDGSSRTTTARPRPEDLRVRAAGGCIDIPPGAQVTVIEAFRNTSSVSFDPGDGGGARVFTVPKIDFTTAPNQAQAAAAAPQPSPVVLATSSRLGVTITADEPNWCARMLQLHVTVEDPAIFDSAEFRALMQRFGEAALTPQCRAAASVRFTGSVRGRPTQWQATASAGTRWVLMPAEADAALNLDDLGSTNASKPIASAAISAPQTSVPRERRPTTPAAPLPTAAVASSAAAPASPASPPTTAQPLPASPALEQQQLAVALAPTAPLPPLPVAACPVAYPGSAEHALPMVCTCSPVAVDRGAVFGTDFYSFDSVPCRAARHAGVVSPEGGAAAFMPVPGSRNLVGSDRNDVDSGAANNVAASVQVRAATPPLAAYIRDINARAQDPALTIAILAPDGRQLVAEPIPPPAFPDASTVLPAPGVVIDLPATDAVSLPVPPPPLAGGLPSIPWLSP